MASLSITEEEAKKARAVMRGDAAVGVPHSFEDAWRNSNCRDAFPNTCTWIRKCYNMPSPEEIRMECLNELLDYAGVEHVEKAHMDYLNAGDPYVPTIVLLDSGSFGIRCVGDYM